MVKGTDGDKRYRLRTEIPSHKKSLRSKRNHLQRQYYSEVKECEANFYL